MNEDKIRVLEDRLRWLEEEASLRRVVEMRDRYVQQLMDRIRQLEMDNYLRPFPATIGPRWNVYPVTTVPVPSCEWPLTFRDTSAL